MNQFLILDGLYTIDKKEILGRGSYGAVYKCYKSNSSEIFAVKVSTIMNDQHRKCALNEATTLSNFNHPNIVGFIVFKYTTNELFLITELCEKEIMNNEDNINENFVVNFLFQFLSGYLYLQSKQCSHRDIKPANILVKDSLYKISDFGFATIIDQNKDSFTISGSLLFMAPEILIGEMYDPKKADVYSLGVTLYNILHYKQNQKENQFPYHGNEINILNQIKKDNFKIHVPISDNLEFLLRNMLKYDVAQRLNWEEIETFFGQNFQIPKVNLYLNQNQINFREQDCLVKQCEKIESNDTINYNRCVEQTNQMNNKIMVVIKQRQKIGRWIAFSQLFKFIIEELEIMQQADHLEMMICLIEEQLRHLIRQMVQENPIKEIRNIQEYLSYFQQKLKNLKNLSGQKKNRKQLMIGIINLMPYIQIRVGIALWQQNKINVILICLLCLNYQSDFFDQIGQVSQFVDQIMKNPINVICQIQMIYQKLMN